MFSRGGSKPPPYDGALFLDRRFQLTNALPRDVGHACPNLIPCNLTEELSSQNYPESSEKCVKTKAEKHEFSIARTGNL